MVLNLRVTLTDTPVERGRAIMRHILSGCTTRLLRTLISALPMSAVPAYTSKTRMCKVCAYNHRYDPDIAKEFHAVLNLLLDKLELTLLLNTMLQYNELQANIVHACYSGG